jgi:glycosyltransferase involved in cell wall biosynthesis
LTPYKGIDVLIEAAGIVRRENWSVEIDFFGAVADVDQNHYPALLQKHGVEDRVRFLGPQDHESLISQYRNYEVFAFPTWEREPFGIGPIEAAAHGGCLPIISRSCGLAEWLVHGIHCLKVEPTAQDLARVFLDLLEWRIDAEPIVNRARASTWRDFHIEAVAPRIESLLLDAASSSRDIRPGLPDEVVRLARLAEGLAQSMIAEAA